MKKKIRLILKKLFSWIFKEELIEMTKIVTKYERDFRRMEEALGNLDVSVDVHRPDTRSSSWAVISIQGEKSDFIKFIDLSGADIRDIQHFLRRYDRSKVDCAPTMQPFLKNNTWYKV